VQTPDNKKRELTCADERPNFLWGAHEVMLPSLESNSSRGKEGSSDPLEM